MQKLSIVWGLCLAVAACGGSSVNRGGEGESCVSRNDCSGSLVCYDNVCAKALPLSGALDGGLASSTNGIDGGTAAPAPGLGGQGESCTKRADCAAGLRCFAGICAIGEPLPVDAGEATNNALSVRGESCTKTSDCAADLVCRSFASNGLGTCDISSYGLTPGTNACYAECKVDLDCCELPLGTDGSSLDGGIQNYNSCADLRKAMTPYNVDNCGEQAGISRECFLYKTYCDCGNGNPWRCTTDKKCSYTRTCDSNVNGEAMKGCPAKSRAGYLVSSCNATTKTCSTDVAGGCKLDDDCTGQVIADEASEHCSPGECACVAASGNCYRKCTADLDCAPGFVCDSTGQKLCKPAGACTTDAQCAVLEGNVKAKCTAMAGSTAKVCKTPCITDQDCSPSGVSSTARFTGSVCGVDKYCASIGCTSDVECSRAVTGEGGVLLGSVKMFCAAPVGGAGTLWRSAITD